MTLPELLDSVTKGTEMVKQIETAPSEPEKLVIQLIHDKAATLIEYLRSHI